MLYPYTTTHYKSKKYGFWVASSLVLKGCTGQGATQDMAIKELESNEPEWLQTAHELARELNSPIPLQGYNED